MYTCGPTVYHFAHIGNLRTAIFEYLVAKHNNGDFIYSKKFFELNEDVRLIVYKDIMPVISITDNYDKYGITTGLIFNKARKILKNQGLFFIQTVL